MARKKLEPVEDEQGVKEAKAQDTEAVERVATKTPIKSLYAKALYAYADFKIGDMEVKAGEKFTPPHGWQRAPQMDELLSASKIKQGAQVGIAFSYQGEVINPGEKNPDLRERRQHTAVLPLEER